MNHRAIFAASALLGLGLSFPHPADASPFELKVSGTISSISALLNSVPTSVPAGIVHIGDTYSLTATFDPLSAVAAPPFIADPHVHIYDLPGASVSLHVGKYSEKFTPLFQFNSTLQLWNDNPVGPSIVDSQSFSFFNYNVAPSDQPFVLGAGLQSQSVGFNAFDFTATARENDLISSLAPLSAFGSQNFTFGLLNSDTNLFVYVQGGVISSSLAPAPVPEPAAWSLMLFGIGSLGAAMRKSRSTGTQSLSRKNSV